MTPPVWVLIVVLHFALDHSTLELPSAKTYDNPDRCETEGGLISNWLTQEGDITVTYKCVTPPVCEADYCI